MTAHSALQIPGWRSSRWFVLGLLMLVGLVNYMDRLSLSILQVPIKRELMLSDGQMGAVTGLAFSVVYTLLAAPLARLADRYPRPRVLAGCLAVWSLMTAGCALAGGFASLAALRMGVAVGEAGCVPAAQALIADRFPPHQRGRALAAWGLVFPLGAFVGIAVGGTLGAALGWRLAFALLGGVGLLLAPVVLICLREAPARGAAPKDLAALPFGSALGSLWASRALRHLVAGGALAVFPLHAALNWNAPFYSRAFHVPMAQLSIELALLSGGAGAAGIVAGGVLSDHLGRRDQRWYMWVPAAAALATPPLMIAQYFAATPGLSLALGIAPVLLMNAVLPPQAAAAQALADPRARALAAAVLVFASGLFAAALAPFVTGVVSDLLVARGLGQDSLRYALAGSSLLAFLGGLHFLRAARFAGSDASG